MQTTLIIGHSGFIGRHLVAELAGSRPDARLIGLSTPEHDLTQDSCIDDLVPHLDGDTTIVFLAGIKRQDGDTLDAFQANINMVSNFCRCLQRAPVRRVIYVSSAAVYGEELHNPAISEQAPVRPTSLYGVAKATAECLIEQTLRSHTAASLMIVRPPLIYGPGDATNSYGPTAFAKAAINNLPIVLWGDGSERREFLYVGDAARLIAGLVSHECTGALNLVSGQSHTYVNVVEEISAALGRPAPTTTRPRTKPKVDHGFSNAVLQKLFPDFRFTTLKEGLRATLADHGGDR